MLRQDELDMSSCFGFYGPQYTRFGSRLAAELRREVYGVDIGQQGWRTATEQAHIADHMRLGPESRVLDIGCGAGGPSLDFAERTGCLLTGLDIEAEGIAYAKAQASKRGLDHHVNFTILDCGKRLPFADGTFDGVLCIDVISHLPDRFGTLSEWARLLDRGGHLVFTDTFVLTGAVAKSELDVRASVGFHLLVPPGLDEEAIKGAGLVMVFRDDRTDAIADIATRWHAARLRRMSDLEHEEGAEWFGQRQRFLATTAELAGSQRLSRFLYVAEKPS